MSNRKLLATAIVAMCFPAAPAAADPLEPGQVLQHVQVQSMAGDRNHEVETTRSSTAVHRVVRDRDRGGKIVREELADARTRAVVDLRRTARRALREGLQARRHELGRRHGEAR